MTTKMVIYFDCDQTRVDFFEDIGELIFWNDNQRDEDSRRHYKDKTTFAFPDLDSFDSSQPDAFNNRLNYSKAYLAIDPRSPAHRMQSTKHDAKNSARSDRKTLVSHLTS